MNDTAEIMAGLKSPTTRQMVKSASEVTLDRLDTPSVGLNLGLGGGLGYGRYTLLWGAKSTGKSGLYLGAIASEQQKGKTAAWIDSELSFDPEWARRLGVDTDKLMYSRIHSIDQCFDTVVELAQAGTDIIVVDSITPLLPSSFFDKTGELKDLKDTKQIGSKSKDLAAALDKTSSEIGNTAVLLVSQLRNKITQVGAYQGYTGGNAIEHMMSSIIKLTTKHSKADQITGEVTRGDKVFTEPIGREINWEIQKNKIGPPFKTGAYNFYYEGTNVGVDGASDAINAALKQGIVTKSGAWYYIGEDAFQGSKAAAAHLRDNPDVYQKIVDELIA